MASTKLTDLPGGPFRSKLAAISQATTMTKAGFRNSDGWTEAKPNENHRTAPFPKSVPNTGSSISATKDSTNPTTPIRRTMAGDIIDTPTIAASARPPKKACRCT